MYFILRDELVDDYLERRPQFHAEHLALAREAVARGELRLGGALAGPADEALLIFAGARPQCTRITARDRRSAR